VRSHSLSAIDAVVHEKNIQKTFTLNKQIYWHKMFYLLFIFSENARKAKIKIINKFYINVAVYMFVMPCNLLDGMYVSEQYAASTSSVAEIVKQETPPSPPQHCYLSTKAGTTFQQTAGFVSFLSLYITGNTGNVRNWHS
jgi:hypothetical protein